MSFFNQFSSSSLSMGQSMSSEGSGTTYDPNSNAGKICPRLPPPTFTAFSETADLCLGWFWTPDFEFSKLEGVISVTVGYAGGSAPWPTYKNIQDYTEAVRVEYDPQILSYEDILVEFFSQGGVPTTPCYSRQYRNAILVHNAEQRKIATTLVNQLAKQKGLKKIYTDIEDATPFYRAEEYHQKYVEKSRGKYRGAW